MDAVVLVKTTDLSTVAGYDGPKLSGKRLITGADWVRQDPDEKHLRLDARALVELDNGSKVVLKSVGVVELTPEVLKALSLTPGAKTGWDVVKTVVTFEVSGMMKIDCCKMLSCVDSEGLYGAAG